MELFFNELSISLVENKAQVAGIMEQFSKTVALARKKGFENIRSYFAKEEIKLANDYTFDNWLNDKSVSKNSKDVLYGMIIVPFIQEKDENEYLKAEYFFDNVEHNISKTECNGLAAAHLYESLSISLSSLPVWDNTKLVISIEQSGQTTSKNVLNISSEKSFENAEIAYFVENMGEIKLVETPILPNDKSISLGSHHGTKPLEVLCNRLKENPYVVSMQSTDNSRGSSHKFIKNVFPDGKIEIVLFKTDSKYAVIVQTTGKNLRETKKIATILDKKYS